MLDFADRVTECLLPADGLVGPGVVCDSGWERSASSEYCHRCGATMGFGAITEEGCSHCVKTRQAWDTVYRLGEYDDVLSHWIVQYKFGKVWRWGDWFGSALSEVITVREDSVVVPIPLHWSRRLFRGFDQAAIIGRRLAKDKGVAYAELLRRVRRTRPQTAMSSKAMRKENVKHAFVCKHVDMRGMTVYLVDDVKTTGATAEQCARLLRKQGAEAIHLVVVGVADGKAKAVKPEIPL